MFYVIIGLLWIITMLLIYQCYKSYCKACEREVFIYTVEKPVEPEKPVKLIVEFVDL